VAKMDREEKEAKEAFQKAVEESCEKMHPGFNKIIKQNA